MQSREKNGLVFVRLFQDADIFIELEKVCKKHAIETGVLLSGIGQLREVKLGFFVKRGDYSPTTFPGPLELISLSGNIVGGNDKHIFHLHASLGRPDKSMVGGHLMGGKVNVTNEIVILKNDIHLKRVLEEETSLLGLHID